MIAYVVRGLGYCWIADLACCETSGEQVWPIMLDRRKVLTCSDPIPTTRLRCPSNHSWFNSDTRVISLNDVAERALDFVPGH